MDNKVKFLRGTATEYEASTKDNDTFYYTTDDEKLYLGNKEITGGGVTIDDTLSDTSKNPVQNKVINAALNSKANLSDIPTELPANGGNADTLDGKHASDFEPYQSYAPIFTGNILDITEMGTYSCSVSDCTNLPPEITSWCYITMHQFRDAGYKQFICSRFNAINSDNSAIIYLASESYKDSEGNLIWSRACDRGNADTLDGKHASDFALKTDIPTTLPANGGMADAARETVSPNAKAKLWEDPEGGNLRLVSPDGNHSVEMDLYNNEGFRMYFTDNGELTFPVDYNSTTKKFNINGNADTVDGKHADDFALKIDIPTTLPANGGNADTVDGKHASDLITHYGLIDDSSLDPNTRGCWDANITGNSIGWANVVQFENGHFITQIAFGASTGKTCSLRLRTRYASSEFESWKSDWNYIETVQNAITANTAGTLATTASNVCLRNLSSGTAAATTTNCPSGAWYGKHS